MIRSLQYVPGKPIRKDIPPGKFPELIKNQQGLLWVDFVSEPPETCLPILEDFQLHPLAIDEALQETHIPKLDDWGTYLHVVLNDMNAEENGEAWNTEVDELDIFLGKNYVVTHHDHALSAVDETWETCDRDARNLQAGADHLLYKIADNLVAGYVPVVEKMDDAISQLEDQVLDRPSPQTLERLFGLKRVLIAMRRILLPQREVLNKLARDDYKVIDNKDRILFRDICERTDQIRDEVLRLENETNRVLSLQSTNTQPFLFKLTRAIRKMVESPSSAQSRIVEVSNPIQARATYDEGSIFISYRRMDSNDVTGRIYDRLISHFGKPTVFKDVDSIGLGSNFRETLENALRECKVVLAIIGDQWVTIQAEDGSRRLDNSEDLVRIEIESALGRRIPLIPVLVQGVRMPPREVLPPSLAKLTDYQGLLVRPDPDFHNDMNRLIKHLDERLR